MKFRYAKMKSSLAEDNKNGPTKSPGGTKDITTGKTTGTRGKVRKSRGRQKHGRGAGPASISTHWAKGDVWERAIPSDWSRGEILRMGVGKEGQKGRTRPCAGGRARKEETIPFFRLTLKERFARLRRKKVVE